MSERTIVHLMRHGEVYNPGGVLYGRLPGFHLSDAGVAMAQAVAGAVTGRDIVHVVASPLERAQETAAPIAAAFGLEVATDARLIEAGNVFEGLTYGVGDGSMRRPTHWKHLRNPLTPSWGEPYHEIADRMIAAAEDARDKAMGHEALLVSHQLPIWTLRRFVEGRRLAHRPDRRQCGLASITSLEYEGNRLASVAYTEPAGHASRITATPGA